MIIITVYDDYNYDIYKLTSVKVLKKSTIQYAATVRIFKFLYR